MRKHTLTAGDHVLVIGFGPVAVRLVEELLPLVETGRLRVTVLGEEDRPGYNRVLVGEYGVGRLDAEGLELVDLDDWRRRGVRVELGTRVDWLDRAARQAHAHRGAEELVVGYDLVVLAVGARPNIPNLRGLNPDPAALIPLPTGVTALRTVADADRMRACVTEGGRVVVLGGGVLGLEVALAAREAGCPVSVVHAAPWLLTRSCDRVGGAMLDRAVADRGLRVIPDAVAREVLLDERRAFRGLRLADGQVITGDLLVLSCGVRVNTRIAEGAGLTTEAGIVVNHELEADPQARVFAIGDCAEVRCTDPVCTVCPARRGRGPAGLIAPGWQQAEWLAARWQAELDTASGPVEPMPTEEPVVVRLKARGLELVAAEETAGEPWEHDPDPAAPRVAHWVDGVGGRFLKLVVREDRLAGFVALGLPRAAAELAVLQRTGAEPPTDPSLLLRLDAPAGGGAGTGSARAADPLCRCAGVSEAAVVDAIDAGADSVAAVRRETRAGSGCGGCGDRVRALLLDCESARAVP